MDQSQSFDVTEWHYIGTQVANAGTQTVPLVDAIAPELPYDSNSSRGGMALTGILADKAGLAVVIGAGILGMSAGAHLMKRRLRANEPPTPRADAAGFISNVGFLTFAPVNMASCAPLVVQFDMWKKVDLGGFRSLVSQCCACPKSQGLSQNANRKSAPPPTEKTPLEIHPGVLDPLLGSYLLGASLTALAAALLLGRVRRINHSILTASSSSVAPPRAPLPARESLSDVGVPSVVSGGPTIATEQVGLEVTPLVTEAFATDAPLLSKSTDVQAALMEAKREASTKGLAGSQVTFNAPSHTECSRSVLTELNAKQLPAVDVEFSVMANMNPGLKPQIGEDTGAYVHGGVVRPRPRTSSKLFRIVPS